jgi:LPS export ABC transporter protein LptC
MEKSEPQKIVRKNGPGSFEFRANLPKMLGLVAIVGLLAAGLWILVGFLGPKDKAFVYKGREVQLSDDVTGVINGFERREFDGQIAKYYIKADKATTFSDEHQELENVYLEAYDETGDKFDKISAARAVYVPNKENSKIFIAQFRGNVDIETRDALRVKTETLVYDRESEIAESGDWINFNRDSISGKSFGAVVNVREKRLELLKDVEVAVTEEDQIENARITAGKAVVEQTTEVATFEHNVKVAVSPKNALPVDARAEKITAHFADKRISKLELTDNVEVAQKPSTVRARFATAFFENELKKIDLREAVEIENVENGRTTNARGNSATAFFANGFQRAELAENVEIDSTAANESPTKIRSQLATYDKRADRFDLKNGAEITTSADDRPTVINSGEAVYEQSNGKIFLSGGAEIKQANDLIKGDSLTAQLFANKKLQNAFASGNAFLRQITPDRTTEISAAQLNASFNENQQISRAEVRESAQVTITPAQVQEYSKMTLSAPRSIQLTFRPTAGESVLSQMQTDGRTTIVLSAPNTGQKAANKKLVADQVKTILSANGRDLLKAEAVGNAELYVEPLQTAPENYKTTINAARFDCDFYETGNNARLCVANSKAKAILQPTVPNRNSRTLTAETLTATFNRTTQDVERFEASGNPKFNEADRNGIAGHMIYTASDETVRLRGGEPTFFDSRARAKAGEIDWDTRNQKTSLRGKVSTTFYSQKQTGGATPFTRTNAPVYLTADEAQFDHQTEVGIYSGNARAWQENNYVRAERLVIDQKARSFAGEGKVQSLLYNVRRKDGGKTSSQPVFASAEKMSYNDNSKLLRYEQSVDIRQGSDRITSGVADIFLAENNEVRQTVVQNDVVITQPKRRVRGTWAQYTTADETVILRGNPAMVEDAEQGTTQGSEMTVAMRENRVVNQGSATAGGTGRTRTVYKVKNQ